MSAGCGKAIAGRAEAGRRRFTRGKSNPPPWKMPGFRADSPSLSSSNSVCSSRPGRQDADGGGGCRSGTRRPAATFGRDVTLRHRAPTAIGRSAVVSGVCENRRAGRKAGDRAAGPIRGWRCEMLRNATTYNTRRATRSSQVAVGPFPAGGRKICGPQVGRICKRAGANGARSAKGGLKPKNLVADI